MNEIGDHTAIAWLSTFFAERPSARYIAGIPGRPPHLNGQQQFHDAPHVYRLLAPGNGFGKTTCAAVECDRFGFDDHPVTRLGRPAQMMWVCQKYQQWEFMRTKPQAWWPRSVTDSWNGQMHFYEWPNRSRLFVITGETEWGTIQGVEPDLVVVDEECDAPLWRELQMRRRGHAQTRFIITATATKGLRWMYHDLYKPWLEYHTKIGMDEAAAMVHQGHRYDDPDLAHLPGIWVWPRGGLEDNPTATNADIAEYRNKTFGSAQERAVRLGGGFRRFAGTPVFDLDAVTALQAGLQDGLDGVIEEYEEKPRTTVP